MEFNATLICYFDITESLNSDYKLKYKNSNLASTSTLKLKLLLNFNLKTKHKTINYYQLSIDG